jgi:ribulose-phosphate 3-epimerase
MTFICPTITASTINEYNAQLATIQPFAERIHIDIMDGYLAPTVSPPLKELPIPQGKILDIHVMYQRPQELSEDLIAIKPNMVIIHAEASVDVPLFATHMREADIQTGLALLPETSVDSVASWLPHVQHVLIFGGHLGYHGGAADLTQLSKVTQLKQLSRYLSFGYDGGANLGNVGIIKDAGIEVINVGSAIHTVADPASAYAQLVKNVS